MTDGFSEERKVGSGAFGEVYKVRQLQIQQLSGFDTVNVLVHLCRYRRLVFFSWAKTLKTHEKRLFFVGRPTKKSDEKKSHEKVRHFSSAPSKNYLFRGLAVGPTKKGFFHRPWVGPMKKVYCGPNGRRKTFFRGPFWGRRKTVPAAKFFRRPLFPSAGPRNSLGSPPPKTGPFFLFPSNRNHNIQHTHIYNRNNTSESSHNIYQTTTIIHPSQIYKVHHHSNNTTHTSPS